MCDQLSLEIFITVPIPRTISGYARVILSCLSDFFCLLLFADCLGNSGGGG